MFVSDVNAALPAKLAWRGVHVSCEFLFTAEEARKKRSFFPEDKVNSDSLFHLCLLFFPVIASGFALAMTG
jgi:hypothetical protein